MRHLHVQLIRAKSVAYRFSAVLIDTLNARAKRVIPPHGYFAENIEKE
jgi:hypothetical protein